VLEGSDYNNPEEEMEDEMCDVMRQLFVENDTPYEIQHPNPQSSSSVHPDLPLVLYNSPSKFVAKLLKVIHIHSVHVRYKTGFETSNNSGNSSISNLGLQGS